MPDPHHHDYIADSQRREVAWLTEQHRKVQVELVDARHRHELEREQLRMNVGRLTLELRTAQEQIQQLTAELAQACEEIRRLREVGPRRRGPEFL